MRNAAFILAIALIGVVPLAGLDDKPWISKALSIWTLQDAEMLLWKSPWAKASSFRFFNSNGAVRKFTFYVRLQSARPVRLALVRAFQMQPDKHVVRADISDSEDMEELAEQIRFPDEIVFSLIAFPPFIHRRLNSQSREELFAKSYILVGRGEKIGLNYFVPPERSTVVWPGTSLV